jgi:V8-like Glu-specific endopeptidase
MQFKLLPVTAAVVSLLTNYVAQAQPSHVVAANSSPEAIAAYWTAERLQNAVPMDMPRVDANSLREVRNINTTPVEGAKAQAPTAEFNFKSQQLFIPINQKQTSVRPQDAGTLNELFTSSQLVPTTNNTVYPFSTVGKIFFTTPSGNKTCTASVIGNRLLLTAGHCVHSGNGSSTGWYTNFMFVPAFNNGSAPFLTWTVTYRGVESGWFYGGGTVPNAMDYGVLEVADQTVGTKVYTLGSVTGKLGWATGLTYPNHAHIIGYSNNFDSGNMMHEVTAQSAKAVDTNNVEYGSDLGVGAGGSPWIQNFGVSSAGETGGTNSTRNTVVGTSSYAYNDTYSFANGGSIFDNNFSDLVNFMCSHAAGNC